MNDRERILTLLQGGTPDRVPWFGDLDYWVSAMIGRGEVPADFKQSVDHFQLHREMRVGFYLQGYFPFHTRYDGNVEVDTWSEGHNRFRLFRTPLGTLREQWSYLPTSYAEAPREHLIKSADDLPALRYVYEHTSFAPDYAERHDP